MRRGSHSFQHFTGKKGSGTKRKSSRAQRGKRHGSHRNKYSSPASERKDVLQGTKFRYLPLTGEPGEVIKAGLIFLWHNRRYELIEDVTIPPEGIYYGHFQEIK